MLVLYFFFFKQKTAYEMRISDWSSDVCSSDLLLSRNRVVLYRCLRRIHLALFLLSAASAAGDLGVDLGKQTRWSRAITTAAERREPGMVALLENGRASCRERGCQDV